MKTFRHICLLGLVAALLVPAVAALAQQETEPRLSMDFRDTPLKDIMQVLKRAGGMGDFSLPEGVGDKRLTVAIVDKTVPEALRIVLAAAKLTAVNDGGVLVIKELPGARQPRPAEQTRVPTISGLVRQPPTASRPEATVTEVGRGTAVTPPGAFGPTGALGTQQAKKDKVFRLITTNYMNLMMLSDMFGGGYVTEDDYRNSTGGSGGYGSNTGGYGDSSYSSGNRGSSRGGNRGNTSSNRSSSRSSGW